MGRRLQHAHMENAGAMDLPLCLTDSDIEYLKEFAQASADDMGLPIDADKIESVTRECIEKKANARYARWAVAKATCH